MSFKIIHCGVQGKGRTIQEEGATNETGVETRTNAHSHTLIA